jgi:hypothetical protein
MASQDGLTLSVFAIDGLPRRASPPFCTPSLNRSSIATTLQIEMICAPLRVCSALGPRTLDGWQESVNVGQAIRLLIGRDRRDPGVLVPSSGKRWPRSGFRSNARQLGPAPIPGAAAAPRTPGIKRRAPHHSKPSEFVRSTGGQGRSSRLVRSAWAPVQPSPVFAAASLCGLTSSCGLTLSRAWALPGTVNGPGCCLRFRWWLQLCRFSRRP